jgi:hypothetical protein
VNAPVAAQGMALYLLLGWKAWHLTRAPRDLSLRCVTACLACAAVAYPFGIAAMRHPAAVATPWLMLIQNTFLVAMAYALDCFFLCSLLPAAKAGQRAARRTFGLTAAVTVMAVAAAVTPRGTNMLDHSVPAVAVFYLSFDLPLGYFLADAWRWARHGIRATAASLARGLKLASAGLALMVGGMVPLTTVLILRGARLPAPAALVTVGRSLVICGILVFLAGVCYPGAVMRLAAARMWTRHRRVYYQLAPLWIELHRVFPQDALARVPSPAWRDALSPWGMHRRYYRRVIECRDGLVRISPRLALGDDGQPLGERLVAALEDLPTVGVVAGEAVLVAVPGAAGLDADAGELVALARQVAAARSRSRKSLLMPGQPRGDVG